MKSTSITAFSLLACVVLLFTFNKVYAEASPYADENFESVDAAVAHITSDLEAKRFAIALIVDHSAAAASVGLELRPTKVIFARQPSFLEYATLRRSATLGIDLPIKFLVYEDELGDVRVSTNEVGYLIDRHDAKIYDVLWKINRGISEQIAKAPTGLLHVKSENDLEATVIALKDTLDANPNFRVPLLLDFCEGNRRRCPQLIVFGNPNAGTPLMQASQEVAIDLPQKFLVWEDANGSVFISYNDPIFIAKRHNVQGQDARLQAISNALANFASQAASIP